MAYEYQEVMNGANYMVQLHTVHWKVTGDEEFLKEFYPSAKQGAGAFVQPASGPGSLADHRHASRMTRHTWNDSEWFEDRSMYGYVVHPGGYRMAAAEMLREWALKMGDTEYVKRLDAMLEAGKEAMQKYLWKGDHYLVYNDPKTGKQLDAFFTPELNGQYCARLQRRAASLPKRERGQGATGTPRQGLQDQQAGHAAHLCESRRHRLDR